VKVFLRDAVPCSKDDKHCCSGRGGRMMAEGWVLAVLNGRVRSEALESPELMR
jgi:hypothetical protein